MRETEVAAGILQFDDGRYLLAERPAGKILGGYLEFPGGKLEAGESPRAALARELEEELGICVELAEPLVQFSHDYPEHRVRAYLYRVAAWRGAPHGREGQKLVWAAPGELRELPLLPANQPILAALELPRTLMVTPRLAGSDARDFLAFFERAMRAGHPEGAILRLKAPPGRGGGPLLQEFAEAAERAGCPLVLNAGEACELPAGFAGLHLPARALAGLESRPRIGGWVGASVHDVGEAEQAGRLGLDYLVAGSLRKTASHPRRMPLGWDGFDAIVRAAGMPVYAIGGMTTADLPEVHRHWGQGIAAIRAFWIPNE
ncbi:MAG: Nudix family hydrolase [Gammaproteobacteria bacterium]|nr:Nudix family hydrolase [Gammaproteobacteria bacterium]